MRFFLLTFLIFFTFTLHAQVLHAQVIISEIMYNLEGTDADREWIEVFNNGVDAVDLESWKLYEGTNTTKSNHTLTLNQGSGTLLSGGYAVVVDDPVTFLIDWPNYSGVLFDSSFSLSNTGETLILRDSELADIDTVTYSSDWGGDGDGNSLTYDDAVWSAQTPTPGSGNFGSEAPITTTEDNTISPSATAEEEETSFVKPPDFIVVEMGKNRTTTVGAAEFFEAKAYQKDGTEHPYATYKWNFGNGVVMEGKKVLHQYNYPGEYVVLVYGVTADSLASTDRITVSAKPADLFVSSVGSDFVALKNNSNRELDLSLWSLRGGSKHFIFPKQTIILPGATITFQNSVTGLNTYSPHSIALIYPNGMVASAYGTKSVAAVASSPQPTVSKPVVSSAVIPIEEPVIGTSVVVEESEEKAFLGDASNQLSVAGASVGGIPSLYLWLLALLSVLGFAIIGVLISSSNRTASSKGDVPLSESTKSKSLSANDFTIIEETSDIDSEIKNP